MIDIGLKQNFHQTVIEGIHYVQPDLICTSDDIENRLTPLYERLRLPKGRLALMTGIHERRFWSYPVQPSQMAAQAARPLLNNEKIDLLIYAGVCRDQLEPATAAHVHQALNLTANMLFFDLSSACLGFVKGMMIAASLIDGGYVQKAIVVSAENGLPLLDHTIESLLTQEHTRQTIKPFFSNLTIGAGAVAMKLAHRSCVEQPCIGSLTFAMSTVDTTAASLCTGDSAPHGQYTMQTDSEALLEKGVRLAQRTWQAFQQCYPGPFHRIITHQVGRAHTHQLYAALNIPRELDFSTYPLWGNIGSASLPLTLAQYLETKPAAGSIALLGIGSGLACSFMHVQLHEQPSCSLVSSHISS